LSRIPEEIIDDIRSRADLVSLIGRYVELKKAGRNWKGLCPFHDEKTPSFNVNADKGIFHCFGCQTGGDAIGFLMKHEGLTFPEAARQLAAEHGIEIPEHARGGDRGRSERLFAATEATQQLYREALLDPESKDAEVARSYLAQRGFDREACERYGIGFAPASWDATSKALRRQGIGDEVQVEAGICSEGRRGSPYDRLRNRVVFPIQDVRGRYLGFGGRALGDDDGPKYMNTPETPIFRKREALYGFPQALEPIRRAERAILCEGYFDRIALDRAGLGEALATCGTALTSDHARQLRRRTREVVLLFDGDAAGQKAVEKALEVLLPEGLRVRAAALPGGQDPDDFLVSEGPEALRALVDGSPAALEVVMRRVTRQGCETPSQKADVVAAVAPLVARVVDPVERNETARRVALLVGTEERAVQAVVRAARPGSREPAARIAAERVSEASARTSGSDEKHLGELAALFARHPELAGESLRDELAELLPEGPGSALVLAVVDAVLDGCVDERGELDLIDAESRFAEAQLARLRELAMSDTLGDVPNPPATMLELHLRWFENRRLRARNRALAERLRSAEDDQQSLLEELQRGLEKKRAAHGIGSRGGDA